MKLFVFLLITLGFLSNAYAQKDNKEIKCKGLTEKKDEFTGQITKSNSTTLCFGAMVIGFRTSGDKYIVDFYIKINGKKDGSLMIGEPLLLKLENGEVVTFKSSKEVAPTGNVSSSSSTTYIVTTYVTEYACTKDDLVKIGNSMPTNLKVTVSGEEYPYKVGKMEGGIILKNAYCITQ
ncbi:MAG: hypothetical protein WCQ95_10820 [Bacteroidota bacterium]